MTATCRYLEERFGLTVTFLPVDGLGQVHPNAVERALTPGTILVSVMHANNETGVLQPIREIAAITHRNGVLMHTDAAQSAGKVPVTVDDLGVDLLSIAGHNVYAPKGVGVLYVRTGVRLDPFIHGASQESDRRASTENVAAIVGLGQACSIVADRLAADQKWLASLRDRLESTLLAAGWVVNGHREQRLPNTLNISLDGVDGEELLRRTPEIAASTGSACHSGRTDPSVLLLLREGPQHGYELLERLAGLSSEDGRIDLGNLYRLLRALEAEGLVSSEWQTASGVPPVRWTPDDLGSMPEWRCRDARRVPPAISAGVQGGGGASGPGGRPDDQRRRSQPGGHLGVAAAVAEAG